MIKLYLGRIVLSTSILVLVLAGFWPHIDDRIPYDLLSLGALSKNHQYSNDDNENFQTTPGHLDHPRLRGYSLKKITEQDVITNSRQNPYGQRSKIFSIGSTLTHHSQNSQRSLSSALLSIIIVCVAIVMMYSVINILSRGRSLTKKSSLGSRYVRGKRFPERTQRTSNLLRKFGSKNMSIAIKYFADELVKQKRYIADEGQRDEIETCSCPCHPTQVYDPNDCHSDLN